MEIENILFCLMCILFQHFRVCAGCHFSRGDYIAQIRSQLSTPVRKCWLNELTSHGWPGRSILCWGYSRNIEFEVALRLIHTYSTSVTHFLADPGKARGCSINSLGKITFWGLWYLVRWDRWDARRPMFPTIPPSPPHPTSMGLFLTY